MVDLEQLRYVRLIADNLGSAADFAQRVLGLEPIDRDQELATFRSDFRDYTLAFVTGDRAVQSVGLEVRYPRDLEIALEGLRGARSLRRQGLGRRLHLAQGQGHGLVHRLQW